MIDSPSGGAPEKAPRWDLMGTEGKIGFRSAPRCFQGMEVYIGEGGRSGEPRGAHEGGGAPRGQARLPASWPPCFFLDVHSKSSGSRLFQK